MSSTEKYHYDKRTQETLERLSVPFAVYQYVDKRVVTLALSDGFCRLFGYEDRAGAYYDMDHNMYVDTHPDDAARIASEAVRFATQGGRYDVIYRSRLKGSSDYRIIHAYGEHVRTETGVKLAHIWYSDEGLYRENSDGQGMELNSSLSSALHGNSIVEANRYDYLTGLPSMTYFFELAEAGKDEVWARGGTPVMLYTDFSGMAFYNTKHGFAEGDQLLQAYGKVLSKLFGNEHCCRIGADHFAVQTEKEGLDDTLQQLLRECRELNGGNTLPLHVGVYVGQEEITRASVACDRAKLACSALSGRYEAAVNYYSYALREDTVHRRYIVENLDRAIAEKWIQIYIQPIIRTVNGRVCDSEALARWHDPEKGVLTPDRFIPALEDAGLMYKLDLYMVDQVVAAIKTQQAEGFRVVPHSINLSRSDFNACDIVEEIRRRVDEAGFSRDRITIEITESVIGSDFAFMKQQVQRFQNLGFSVWMDDFGSGYSSLEVLQSIRFDLLKFDMSFMKRLDEGESARILLTELMRMANSLGADTVCEGVETEGQVRFLREIGCSKLQGYYFSKPMSFADILVRRRARNLIETENPAESEYYESIGRVSLYDLRMVSDDEDGALRNVYNMIPISVQEITEGKGRYVKSNRSYRDFVKRSFGIDVNTERPDFNDPNLNYTQEYISAVRRCFQDGARVFFDEKLPDGSIAHSFVRRIGINPVTGSVAIAAAVLSIRGPDESETYADIAGALAADYYNIYIIDLDTNDFFEYSSRVGDEEMSLERRGKDFFASARRDTMTRIYEEDRAPFLALFTRENVLRELDDHGVFTTTYRLIDTGTPTYVNMKITRMHGGNRLILGVSIVDAHMRQKEENERLRSERIAFNRLAALSGDYIVMYTVDPETDHYVEYSASSEFNSYGLAKEGEDFYGQVRKDAPKALYPDDLEEYLQAFTKENVMQEIRRCGIYSYHYRLVINGKVRPVIARAALVGESDGDKLVLGVTDDEEEFKRQLEAAYQKASSTATIYTHIAHALARGYTDLYYVNMDTDALIEFHTDDEHGVLNEIRRSTDFFEGCKRDVKLFVHPEDQAAFVRAMDRQFLTNALRDNRVFKMTYRRIKGSDPFYVEMEVTRMEDDPRMIVIAVSDIDELVRKRRDEERIREERLIYARLHALTGNFIVVYVVDPDTGKYREFSAAAGYAESFSQAQKGTDFFATLRQAAAIYSHPNDRDRVLAQLTQDNVMGEIARTGIFTLGYRILMEDKYVHFQLKAAMVEEEEGPRLIVGLNNIDAQVRQEEEYERRLAEAQTQANIDALTGVKNKHAYLAAEVRMDRQIAEQRQGPFAVVMLDVNNLKAVNDTAGHQAGDRYLRDACQVICRIFKHSPVFRVGGDEFAVISQGSDYEHMEELLEKVAAYNAEASRGGGVLIACGMAKFDGDDCVASVFQRADHAMYVNKNTMKSDALPAAEIPQRH